MSNIIELSNGHIINLEHITFIENVIHGNLSKGITILDISIGFIGGGNTMIGETFKTDGELLKDAFRKYKTRAMGLEERLQRIEDKLKELHVLHE